MYTQSIITINRLSEQSDKIYRIVGVWRSRSGVEQKYQARSLLSLGRRMVLKAYSLRESEDFFLQLVRIRQIALAEVVFCFFCTFLSLYRLDANSILVYTMACSMLWLGCWFYWLRSEDVNDWVCFFSVLSQQTIILLVAYVLLLIWYCIFLLSYSSSILAVRSLASLSWSLVMSSLYLVRSCSSSLLGCEGRPQASALLMQLYSYSRRQYCFDYSFMAFLISFNSEICWHLLLCLIRERALSLRHCYSEFFPLLKMQMLCDYLTLPFQIYLQLIFSKALHSLSARSSCPYRYLWQLGTNPFVMALPTILPI